MPSRAASMRNLERSSVKNAPTTMTKIQDRMHELEDPISCADLARDLGIGRGFCGRALNRLVAKGLVVRKRKRAGWVIQTYAGHPTQPARKLRHHRMVWFYEILQEK